MTLLFFVFFVYNRGVLCMLCVFNKLFDNFILDKFVCVSVEINLFQRIGPEMDKSSLGCCLLK